MIFDGNAVKNRREAAKIIGAKKILQFLKSKKKTLIEGY